METAEEYEGDYGMTLHEESKAPAKVDTKTGEISAKFENEFDVSALLNTAGTIELTEAQKAILYAPVKEEDVEIRPDGLVYLPWMEYVTRLQKSFGLSWAIIPQGMPKFHKTSIYWGFWLVIQGKLAGYAMGEQAYHPSNATMTYSDAVEGAKSNALMRLCKGIGISLELWKPSFVRAWKEKYAESYYDDKKHKYLWQKKGNVNHIQEDAIPHEAATAESNPEKPVPMTEKQRGKLWAMMKTDLEMTDTEARTFMAWVQARPESEVIDVTKDGKATKVLSMKSASNFIEHFELLFNEFTKS